MAACPDRHRPLGKSMAVADAEVRGLVEEVADSGSTVGSDKVRSSPERMGTALQFADHRIEEVIALGDVVRSPVRMIVGNRQRRCGVGLRQIGIAAKTEAGGDRRQGMRG